jgi:hypothetical protein
MALADLSTGYGFYFQVVDLATLAQNYSWATSPTPVEALDASISPTGVAYACGVSGTGNAWLLWADLLGGGSTALRTAALLAADLTTIEDCAITVTADSVAVIALRGGDDIAFATVQVP